MEVTKLPNQSAARELDVKILAAMHCRLLYMAIGVQGSTQTYTEAHTYV